MTMLHVMPAGTSMKSTPHTCQPGTRSLEQDDGQGPQVSALKEAHPPLPESLHKVCHQRATRRAQVQGSHTRLLRNAGRPRCHLALDVCRRPCKGLGCRKVPEPPPCRSSLTLLSGAAETSLGAQPGLTSERHCMSWSATGRQPEGKPALREASQQLVHGASGIQCVICRTAAQ